MQAHMYLSSIPDSHGKTIYMPINSPVIESVIVGPLKNGRCTILYSAVYYTKLMYLETSDICIQGC